MNISTIIDELAKPENHAKRNLLKWLQSLAMGGAGVSVAVRDPWSIVVSVVAFAIAKVMEGRASVKANDERLNQVDELERAEDEQAFDRPDYNKIYRTKGTLTKEQKEMREKCGIPSDEDIQAEVKRIERSRVKPAYRVRIRQPGKKSKFITCKSLKEAKKLYQIEVDSGKHPEGTEIEVVPPPK